MAESKHTTTIRTTWGSHYRLSFDNEGDARAFANKAIRSDECLYVNLSSKGIIYDTVQPNPS